MSISIVGQCHKLSAASAGSGADNLADCGGAIDVCLQLLRERKPPTKQASPVPVPATMSSTTGASTATCQMARIPHLVSIWWVDRGRQAIRSR
jgi:hypothetical protein